MRFITGYKRRLCCLFGNFYWQQATGELFGERYLYSCKLAQYLKRVSSYLSLFEYVCILIIDFSNAAGKNGDVSPVSLAAHIVLGSIVEIKPAMGRVNAKFNYFFV